MIYTFYSYKGGVGRTMALANVAELLYRAGKRVLMIDWDLEAPGLEHFFFPPDQLSKIRQRRGIIDLVLGYKRQMTRKLDLSDPDNLPFEKPIRIAQRIPDNHSGTRVDSTGELWLITAGRRLDETPGEYASRVLNFDWLDFYERWQGEAYFDWFRRECRTFADVILIDSRTGVTEMGGVCTYHLADVVVLFCGANRQNIQGTLDMVHTFAQADPQNKRIEQGELFRQRGGRPLKTLVAPARIDLSETTPETTILQELAPALRIRAEELQDLMIPYIAAYSAGEHLAVTYNKEQGALFSPRLIDAYKGLSARLSELGEEVRQAWQEKLTGLEAQLKTSNKTYLEFLNKKILETELEEKHRISDAIEQIEQQHRAIGEQVERLQRELHYYL